MENLQQMAFPYNMNADIHTVVKKELKISCNMAFDNRMLAKFILRKIKEKYIKQHVGRCQAENWKTPIKSGSTGILFSTTEFHLRNLKEKKI